MSRQERRPHDPVATTICRDADPDTIGAALGAFRLDHGHGAGQQRELGTEGGSCTTTRSPTRNPFHSNLSMVLLLLSRARQRPGRTPRSARSRCGTDLRVVAPSRPTGCIREGADPHAGGAGTPPGDGVLGRRGAGLLSEVIAGATDVPVADEVAVRLGRRRAMPCRHRGVVGAGASSRSCLCGRGGSGAVGAQERRSARRAGPPLRHRGWVKRRVALEHLAAASALAGTHVLRLLLGGNHSHDVHRGLPSRPQTTSAHGGCALEQDRSYSGKIKLAK